MDELLSLFDNNTGVEASVTDVKSRDVLTQSFRDARKEDDFSSAFVLSKPVQNNESNLKPSPAINTANTAVKTSSGNVVCDPITGLRITNRKTSRAEMVDHFAPLTYKSVSLLAASSRSEWTTYTTDGSEKGATNLATCGIIVADTSSRISSNTGRAFGTIQLGDLTSPSQSSGGPTSRSNNIHALVTVFLFGEALGVIKRHKRFLQKGWVCAILSPNLMPSREGSSTAVSLSVNDPRQILLIGKSIDCGNCRGTIRKKVSSEYGPRWEDVGCSTLIDLRGGSAYCLTHRRQGLSSRGTMDSKTNKIPDNRLQKIRADNKRNGITHITTFSSHKNLSSSQNVTQGGRTTSSISLAEALSQPSFLEQSPPIASSTTTMQHLKRAPKHMKKAANGTSTKVTNPYVKAKSAEQSAKRKDNTIFSSGDILGQALERKKARLDNNRSVSKKYSKQQNGKPKKVFHAEGYDGSVQVPKPSSLFRKAAITVSQNSSSNSNRASATSNVLEKQRTLAELLRQKKNGVVNNKTEDLLSRLSSRTGQAPSVKNKTPRSNFASTFGSSDNLDRDSLLSAQSRFASAASAQEYARARGAIQELEAKEFEMDQRKQRKDNSNSKGGKVSDATKKQSNIVTAGWICRSCKKKTPFKPVSCIRARHDVQQHRELKNRISSVGSTKERLQRHGKDAEEGGLTLGSGLEWSWSGYRR